MRNGCVRVFMGVSLILLGVGNANAGPTDNAKCQAAKNKASGKYLFCRLKADAKALTTGTPADYSKCSTKFDDKWDSAETNYAANCPDNVGMSAPMDAFLAEQATTVAAIVAGTEDTSTCGDGVIEGSEDCDWGTVGGADCNSATGGTLPLGTLDCTVGACTFDTSGCASCVGGQVVGGSCWYLGATSASCDATCAAQGKVYSTATATYAGSGGTLANCLSVLTALGGAVGSYVGDLPGCAGAGGAIGCFSSGVIGSYGRCPDPTTDGPSAIVSFSRACACQ